VDRECLRGARRANSVWVIGGFGQFSTESVDSVVVQPMNGESSVVFIGCGVDAARSAGRNCATTHGEPGFEAPRARSGLSPPQTRTRESAPAHQPARWVSKCELERFRQRENRSNSTMDTNTPSKSRIPRDAALAGSTAHCHKTSAYGPMGGPYTWPYVDQIPFAYSANATGALSGITAHQMFVLSRGDVVSHQAPVAVGAAAGNTSASGGAD